MVEKGVLRDTMIEVIELGDLTRTDLDIVNTDWS